MILRQLRSSPWLAVILGFVLLGSPSDTHASTLALPASLDGTVTHSADFFGDPFGFQILDSLGLTTSSFTEDLGSLSAISIDLTAPGAQTIQVDLPPGVPSGTLEVLLRFSLPTVSAFAEPWSFTSAFQDVVGVEPTATVNDAFGRIDGSQATYEGTFTFDESFSFSGLTVDITGPFTSAGTQTYAPIETRFDLFYFSQTVEGQFVNFVPEPTSFALLGLGGLSLFCRRRTES